jgi:hypothetical protein
LNQIEIYFSILQRKALVPNGFKSLETIKERLLGFQLLRTDCQPVWMEIYPERSDYLAQ